MQLLPILEGFEWDDGNRFKNWQKHKVSPKECEEIFPNRPLLFQHDQTHSKSETRFAAYGQTDQGRSLTVVFTVRNKLIRVISARDQNKKERQSYEEAKKSSPQSPAKV